MVTIICVVIFAIVAGVSVYAIWKFRAPPGDTDDGSPIHGHTGLEIVWTLIPTVLVTAIAIYSSVALAQITDLPADHRTVEVQGEQFTWTFTYPDIKLQNGQPLTTGELVVPIGQAIGFDITAKDVIHSFWVPEWRMKQDAVPGIVTRITVTPTRTGTFPVICTELCGLGHALMRSQARVVSASEFEAWVKEQRRLARRGRRRPGQGALHAAVRQLPRPRRRRHPGTGRPEPRRRAAGNDRRADPQSIVDPNAEYRQGVPA